MKPSKYLVPIAVAAATLVGASAAHAALIVQITSGASTVTIADGSALDGAGFLPGDFDFNGTAGAIGYTGGLNGWEIALAIASGVNDPFQMHLSSIVGGGGGEGPITIKLTQTDLTAGPLGTIVGANGGGAGAGAASWSAWVDDANMAFAQVTNIGTSSGYGGGAFSASPSLSGLYSATLVTTFDYTAVTPSQYGLVKTSSLDVGMQVPEPTSIALIGLALVGAGLASRRKA